MSYYGFHSPTAVASMLVGVAMLATLATSAMERFGGSEQGHGVVLVGCLAAVWATAILVIVLIKLTDRAPMPDELP